METVKLLALILALMGQTVGKYHPDVYILSLAMNSFSQRLYTRLIPRDTFVYSPYSIHSALTMAYFGARTDTEKEMASRLGVGSFKTHKVYHDMMRELLKHVDVSVNVAFSVVYNKNAVIEKEFLWDVKNTFWSVQGIFSGADPASVTSVNNLVAQKTENNIKQILNPRAVTQKTSLLLVHVIYFKGAWKYPFSPSSTWGQTFNLATGQKKKVQMMHGDTYVYMRRNNDFRADVVELTFRGGRFGFYIALPHKINGIDELEKLVTEPEQINLLFKFLNYKYVTLAIPKFRIDSIFSLKNIIRSLGFLRSFTPNHADFRGISTNASLYLTDVVHAAMIDMQEWGVSFGAASATTLGTRQATSKPQESFVADRPFLFFIRDKLYGSILFQGKYSG